MRKIGLLFITIFCLLACKNNSSRISLEGEIKGLTNDTLYLYGTDALYDRIDTIYAEKGKFSYNLNIDSTVIDTLTTAVLLINGHVEYPVFLDKGNQITIKGNIDDLSYLDINGNEPNTSLSLFMKEQRGLGSASDKMMQEKAETFIRQHNFSFASIYLLDKYFVQKENPDFDKIKELINIMAGILQDKPRIGQLTEYIGQLEKVNKDKAAPFFSIPNEKGEKITRTGQFKDKYLLINFWASWCEDCDSTNVELRKINAKYKKSKDFGILGISLDIDKKAWKNKIKQDTLNWEQVCTFTGWDMETAKQYAVQKLPVSILVSPSGRILARDIPADSLSHKVEEVLKKNEKK